jgi:hypothetical protein
MTKGEFRLNVAAPSGNIPFGLNINLECFE